MADHGLILITMDEVRPDHLSCYGYSKIKTPNIDSIAEMGVIFETCISSSCFTPISHATILTGVYPPVHKVRNPYTPIQAVTLPLMLKERSYKTAGFVGVSFLGSSLGFDVGFDHFDEPTAEGSWALHRYKEDDPGFWGGNWWVERMLNWLKENYRDNFFIWGHYFECHLFAERELLKKKKIKEGELSEFGYYDAKIKYMDEALFGPLIETLRDLNILDRTTIVVTSDHGTNLGEHPVPPLPLAGEQIVYPQHSTMYDCDLKVPLIIKSRGLPENRRIRGMVRSVDIVPTILELLDIPTKGNFDGVNLLPFIREGEVDGLIAYSEDLFEERGGVALQAIRTDRYKLIRNNTTGVEELYDLEADPLEQRNLVMNPAEELFSIAKEMRKQLDKFLEAVDETREISGEDRERIESRLRILGYIK